MSTNRSIPDVTDLFLDARLALDELQQKQIIGQDVFEPSIITTENTWDIDINPSSIPIRVMWEWRIRFYPTNTTDVRIGNALRLSTKTIITPSTSFAGGEIERFETGTPAYDEWRYYLTINAGTSRHQTKFYVQAVGGGTITVERVA